ncbi:prepilin peptidase [Candidatus Woesearchaeota archaeon]|nr:prepilin peptidase [Candidatus Woesearchaeota archaeon]
MDYFTIFESINIIIIIVFGIITSYQDLKYNKIRNKWVVIAILSSVLSLLIAIFYLKSKGTEINIDYIKIYFINILISLVFGFFLWLSNLWAPGDAKLFLAYAALVPLSVYKWGNTGYFPSYILLINTVTPVFLYFIVKIIFKIKFKILLRQFILVLDPKFLFSSAIFLFGFYTITTAVLQFLKIQSTMVFNVIFILILMLFFTNILNINMTAIGFLLSIIRFVFDFQNIFSLTFLINFLMLFLFFVLLRYFVLNLSFIAFSKPIYIESLKQGMCLAEDIIESKGEYTKKKETSISFVNSIFEAFQKKETILDNYKSLTKEDVKKINTLHSGGKIKEHIIFIHEKIHFAVSMFIGVIITLLCRGNFLIFLRQLLESFIN